MLSPTDALDRLRQGNARFVSGSTRGPGGPQERAELVEGQTPFAAVLGCADSRVPPEIVFDQPPGTLFVVRVAGNTAGPSELASLEFAVSQLGVRLVVVLGHSGCGAVTAALDAMSGAATELPVHLARAVASLSEDLARGGVSASTGLDEAVGSNVSAVVDRLRTRDSAVAAMVASGKGEVAGGVYDLASGEVRFG